MTQTNNLQTTNKAFNETCPICLDEITPIGNVNLSCNHALCLTCFMDNVKSELKRYNNVNFEDLKDNLKCPLCRCPVIEKELYERLRDMRDVEFIRDYEANYNQDPDVYSAEWEERRQMDLYALQSSIDDIDETSYIANYSEEIINGMELSFNLWDRTTAHLEERKDILLEQLKDILALKKSREEREERQRLALIQQPNNPRISNCLDALIFVLDRQIISSDSEHVIMKPSHFFSRIDTLYTANVLPRLYSLETIKQNLRKGVNQGIFRKTRRTGRNYNGFFYGRPRATY